MTQSRIRDYSIGISYLHLLMVSVSVCVWILQSLGPPTSDTRSVRHRRPLWDPEKEYLRLDTVRGVSSLLFWGWRTLVPSILLMSCVYTFPLSVVSLERFPRYSVFYPKPSTGVLWYPITKNWVGVGLFRTERGELVFLRFLKEFPLLPYGRSRFGKR